MQSAIKSRNSVCNDVFGVNLCSVGMRVATSLKIQVVLQKRPLLFPFVDCRGYADDSHRCDNDNNEFHTHNIRTFPEIFKLGALPC